MQENVLKTRIEKRSLINCMYCKDPCIRIWGDDGFGIKIVCHLCDTVIKTCELCSFEDIKSSSWSPFKRLRIGECIKDAECAI